MRRAAQLWLAARLGAWLCSLPVRMRLRSLPALLERLTPARARPGTTSPAEIERAVRIALRVCHLRLFRPPIFPRVCLRQALALYYTLSRTGQPVRIHFGVHEEGTELRGHSWVTVEGEPVAERRPTDGLRIVYTYPPHSSPRHQTQGRTASYDERVGLILES